MRIEIGAWANCSEAVFRFYTLDPKQIQFILQSIADEISASTNFEPHKNQKIPLFKTAEEYDTGYNGEMSYHGEVRKKYEKQINEILTKRDIAVSKTKTSKEREKVFDKHMEKYWEIMKKIDKEIYPNSLLRTCAGLGDNDCVITIEKDKGAFRLNIGNNNLQDKTPWVENILGLNIKVEEAERCEDLEQYARDCTCGCIFFDIEARDAQIEQTKKVIEEMKNA